MSLNFYRPNKSNRGSLLSVNFIAKTDKFEDGKLEKGDKAFFLSLVAQTGWDEKSKTGSFKDGAKINTKMSMTEMAAIRHAVKYNVTMAEAMGAKYVFHDNDNYGVIIAFGPGFKKEKKGDDWVDTNIQAGYTLRVTKTDKKDKDKQDSISINLNYAEAELLLSFIEDGLIHIFNALRSEDINRFNEKTAPAKAAVTPKKEVKKQSPTPAAPVAKNEPEPVTDGINGPMEAPDEAW